VDNGIAEQVQKRFDKRIEQLGVDFNVLVVDGDFGQFVFFGAGDVDRPAETRGDGAQT